MKSVFIVLCVCLVGALTFFNAQISLAANLHYDSQQNQQSGELVDEFDDELDDDFDELDAKIDVDFLQIDAELEARYKAVHEAIQAAFDKQTHRIEVKWPTDVVVPTGAVWVAYSEDYEERVVYDFEQGYYRLEIAQQGDLRADLRKLATLAKAYASTTQQVAALQKNDVFTQAIIEEVAKVSASPAVAFKNQKKGQTASTIAASANYQVIADISPNIPALNEEDLLLQIEQQEQVSNKVSSKNEDIHADSQVDKQPFSLSPLKQDIAEQAGKSASSYTLEKTLTGWALQVPFVNRYQERLIGQRMDTILEMSDRFNVEVSLILAIIEAESSFNPMATSHIPAFGLMQLVPHTAGIDAYRHVYGQHRILSPDYLYDVENNIKLGTAYIDLLQSRYLQGISNADNKLYSMIASYNTGVGNLANTVSGTKRIRSAIGDINAMKSDDYYQFLQTNLPATETKRYLEKVITKKSKYKYLDGL